MTQSPSPIVDEVADLPPWTETEAWLVGYIDDLKRTPNRFAGEIWELEIVLKRLRAASLVSPPKAGALTDRLAAWFNSLPDGGMGKEHFDALLSIVANHEARGDGVMVKPLSLEGFAADFNAAMERTGATVRGLADDLGVDKSAISRVRTGKQVTQSNFIAMLNWLNALEAALPPLGDGRAEALGLIHQAIDGYVSALVAREHGGVAQNRAFEAICQALGRNTTEEMGFRIRSLSNPGGGTP